MYKISGDRILNITNKDLEKRRAKVLSDIPREEFISFKSKNEKYSVTIFTDVDCGYCKKLHSEIQEYNNLGITINYAAFPRSGIGTESFTKMVGAWCSSNPKKTLSALKSGEKLTLNQIPIDPQLTEKIFKFASIKHILNNHQNDQNKMFELLEEVTRDLKNYDLEFRIEELESKFSKDLSESTFNEIRELKKQKNIN